MMTTSTMSAAASNDADLVADTLAGNREAFGQIVARYQSLICSLAYSATGSLGQSEDLAQETFITAWKRLRLLREPPKLRAWLCGIARNRINDSLRREGRQPLADSEPLDAAHDAPAPEPLPPEQTISHEEETILWRSLERIPPLYREPLVLFYRQHQSIERVAEALELSEDAVKQRLSRGRKLLHEQVLAFVEGTLEKTNPGRAFTLGVLAALPLYATSAAAATVGATAAKGSATAKAAATAGVVAAVAGPLIAFLGTYIGYRFGCDTAQYPRERELLKKFYRLLCFSIGAFILLTFPIIFYGRTLVHSHPWVFASMVLVLVTAYTTVVVVGGLKLLRQQSRLVRDHAAGGARQPAAPRPRPAWEYRSPLSLLGLPLLHIRIGGDLSLRCKPLKAWIAVADTAIGVLFAYGGVAIAPLAVGGLAIGLVPLGGCAIGLVALGGLSLGWWSFGGCAVGWLAFGGCALAWQAALGQLALAREFALGAAAYAAHFNDATAQALAQNTLFFRWANVALRYLWLINLAWIIPMIIWWRVEKRSHATRAQ
ncbi:MAG TPA: sigma-70 family RNA polymerase sigma factor [Candidatus Paceibacterota bacterium]|nr:sigma-70 family RNA polymerase sigma factor [Verrucomicrobiota bacterium]HSA12666.1 sigma-70 family RNA polymerase sigma factor [Candidatus Paceibacterota bacterium]